MPNIIRYWLSHDTLIHVGPCDYTDAPMGAGLSDQTAARYIRIHPTLTHDCIA